MLSNYIQSLICSSLGEVEGLAVGEVEEGVEAAVEEAATVEQPTTAARDIAVVDQALATVEGEVSRTTTALMSQIVITAMLETTLIPAVAPVMGHQLVRQSMASAQHPALLYATTRLEGRRAVLQAVSKSRD